MKHLHVLILALHLVAFSLPSMAGFPSIGVQAARAAQPGQAGAVVSRSVVDAFQNGAGRTPVIALLKDGAVSRSAVDPRSPLQRDMLAASTRAAQSRVLSRLGLPGDVKTRLFAYVPGFAASLSQGEVEALMRDPDVVAIQADEILLPHTVQGLSLTNATVARQRYDGSGVSVAVLDTGIDYNHPDLGGGGFPNAKVIGGYDVGDDDADPIDQMGHGTACAGIAAGDIPVAPPSVGDYAGGMANAAKLYAVKITLGTQYYALTSAVVAAWEWCVTHQDDDPRNPILVISMSYGSGRSATACDAEFPALAAAAALAEAAGIVIFNSAGNDGYCDAIDAPACLSGVMSVGALYVQDYDRTISWSVNESSCKATTIPGSPGQYAASDVNPRASQVTVYSNSAPFLKLVGASTYVSTTDPMGVAGFSPREYNTAFAGTSAATPFSAGSAAILQSASFQLTGAYLTPAQIKNALIGGGDPVTDPKSGVTTPRVNLGGALSTALGAAGAPVLDDHGDSIVQATSLAPGNSASGVLTRADRDCFQIDLATRGDLTISSSGLTPVRGQLLNVSGAVVPGVDSPQGLTNFTLQATLDAGTYFLLVRGATADSIGDYSVTADSGSASFPLSAFLPSIMMARQRQANDR